MTCVKTGARVYFADYGILVAADLHQVAGATLIRFNPNSKRYVDQRDSQITHEVSISMESFFSQDGNAVVPNSFIKEVPR